jgi:hypothetical protein
MQCPDCGGEVWNNAQKNEQRAREGKKPMPLWTCKDKDGCGWKKWPDKKTDTAPKGSGHAPAPRRALGPVYNECLDFAKKAVTHHFGKDVATTDIIAAAATLFIQAAKTGQSIRPRPVAPKPAPPPPPPPPAPEFEDFPGEEEFEEGLPF